MGDDSYSIEYENGLRSLAIQELERNRISSDLHDTVVQNLTGLILKVQLCNRLVDQDPSRVKMELSLMADTLKDAIFDLREVIYDLRPPSFSDYGLVHEIEDYCENSNKLHNINFYFVREGNERRLDNYIELNLYRIAQEACNNIIKHSKATRAEIKLSFLSDSVVLTISDNGVGFLREPEFDCMEIKSFGTKIMEERTELMKGTFEISSEASKGTILKITVPYLNIYE